MVHIFLYEILLTYSLQQIKALNNFSLCVPTTATITNHSLMHIDVNTIRIIAVSVSNTQLSTSSVHTIIQIHTIFNLYTQWAIVYHLMPTVFNAVMKFKQTTIENTRIIVGSSKCAPKIFFRPHLFHKTKYRYWPKREWRPYSYSLIKWHESSFQTYIL